METTAWGHEEEAAEADFANTAVIVEEVPRAVALPITTRYRCFVDELAESQSLQRCRYGSSFVVHKRRRQELTPSDDEDATVLCIPRRRATPFDVAQRRLDTFRWLSQVRSTEDIQSRFALDRRVGAAPSLASLRRAVEWLRLTAAREDLKEQQRRAARDAIVDLLEELVLDGSRCLSPALCLDIVAALAHTPVPVARLLLARHATQPPAALALLRTVWAPLCSALASVALSHTAHTAAPLDPGFVAVLARVVELTRAAGELSLVHVAAYGRCLLTSRVADGTSRARLIGLIRQDVLNAPFVPNQPSGTERDATQLVLGAFLSDVISALCEDDTKDDAATPTSVVAENTVDAVAFGCEVVHYAASRKLMLTPRSVEALIVTAAAAQAGPAGPRRAPRKALALFVFMCVLSTPTAHALSAALDCAFDYGEGECALRPVAMTTVLPGNPVEFFVWCARRFAGALFSSPLNPEAAALQATLASRLGAMLCFCAPGSEERTAEWWCRRVAWASDVLGALGHAVPSASEALLGPLTLALIGAVAALPSLASSRELQRLSVEAQCGLLDDVASRGLLQPYWTAVEANLRGVSPPPTVPELPPLLQSGIAAECSCNVLDVAACNSLAAHHPKEAAFVKMMDGYMSKKGALALVPLQCLTQRAGMTDGARAMLRRWHHDHGEWFVCLPLALSLTLGGHDNMFDAVCELFRTIQRNGHRRVAIMTGDETLAVQAKACGIQATIYLDTLLSRLGA